MDVSLFYSKYPLCLFCSTPTHQRIVINPDKGDYVEYTSPDYKLAKFSLIGLNGGSRGWKGNSEFSIKEFLEKRNVLQDTVYSVFCPNLGEHEFNITCGVSYSSIGDVEYSFFNGVYWIMSYRGGTDLIVEETNETKPIPYLPLEYFDLSAKEKFLDQFQKLLLLA